MENPTREERETLLAKQHNSVSKEKEKGGLITVPFIIATEAFETVARNGLSANMIVYLMKGYNMTLVNGTKFLNYWSAANNFTGLFGAFIADSYIGRFLAIGSGSVLSFMGILLIWSTTMVPNLKPNSCDKSNQMCESATTFQMSFLIFSFVLMAIGAAGISSCSLAFGADQLDNKHKLGNNKVLGSFFSWYYASSAIAMVFSMTCIVYIQDRFGWKLGFGVPVVFMFLSGFLFFLASPFYIKKKATQSLFTDFARVLVAAYNNRNVMFPPLDSNRLYHRNFHSRYVAPTSTLRFLNKACIIKNPKQDLTVDELPLNPWRLCTIEQVEKLKAIIKVIPLWSTFIMTSINTSQGSFGLVQAKSMNRHITSTFEIPAASFGMTTILFIIVWITIYDRVILPLASKIKGEPFTISPIQRMGIGMFLSIITMIVSGITENTRRRKAIKQGFIDNPEAVIDMSAMWLLPQHFFSGVAEAFLAVSQCEFYYSEFSSIASIASAVGGTSMGVGNLLANFILSSVDDITSKGNQESWVSSNINKGHYDYYYWLLAILSFFNLLYFIVCSRYYGPSGKTTIFREEEEEEEEELDMN